MSRNKVDDIKTALDALKAGIEAHNNGEDIVLGCMKVGGAVGAGVGASAGAAASPIGSALAGAAGVVVGSIGGAVVGGAVVGVRGAWRWARGR